MNAMLKTGALAALTVTLLGGCASYTGQTNDPNDPNRTRTGALIGAGIGAVAGLLSGSDATERRQRALVGAHDGDGVPLQALGGVKRREGDPVAVGRVLGLATCFELLGEVGQTGVRVLFGSVSGRVPWPAVRRVCPRCCRSPATAISPPRHRWGTDHGS